MEDIGPSGRVTSQTGNVDHDGDIVGSLLERLRGQVGPDHSAEITPDEQAVLAAALLLAAPLRAARS